MDPHERATSVWYRVAGLLRRKELAIDIIEAERSGLRQQEVLVEASKLVLTGEPIEIARTLRDRAGTRHPADWTRDVTPHDQRAGRWLTGAPGHTASPFARYRVGPVPSPVARRSRPRIPSCSIGASSGHGVLMICSPARSK
jgi:hypothetical protein